jgi:hypothetical protein
LTAVRRCGEKRAVSGDASHECRRRRSTSAIGNDLHRWRTLWESNWKNNRKSWKGVLACCEDDGGGGGGDDDSVEGFDLGEEWEERFVIAVLMAVRRRGKKRVVSGNASHACRRSRSASTVGKDLRRQEK